MSGIAQLRRYWRRFSEWLWGDERDERNADQTEETDNTASAGSGEQRGGPGWFDPEELESRADVLAELGITPAEFVIRLLEEHDGQLRQQAFTEYTDWSEGTVSRTLQELEDEGYIVRVQMGRENVVCLPDHTPARDQWPPTDEDDAHSA